MWKAFQAVLRHVALSCTDYSLPQQNPHPTAPPIAQMLCAPTHLELLFTTTLAAECVMSEW